MRSKAHLENDWVADRNCKSFVRRRCVGNDNFGFRDLVNESAKRILPHNPDWRAK